MRLTEHLPGVRLHELHDSEPGGGKPQITTLHAKKSQNQRHSALNRLTERDEEALCIIVSSCIIYNS